MTIRPQPGAAAQAGEGARARAPRRGRGDEARRRAVRARARARLRQLAEAEAVHRAPRRSSSRSAPTSSTTRAGPTASRRRAVCPSPRRARDLAAAARLLELARARAPRRGAARRRRSRRRRSCSPTARSRTDDRERLVELLDRYPELVRQRGTNGNDLLGMAGDLALVRLLLERGADPNRGNDYGWTKLHQAGYSNRPRARASCMLDAGARIDLFARGDGGTPLVAALFWGHREVVDLLGREPRQPARRRRARRSRPDPRARRHAGRPARTAASTGRTAASPPGSRRTIRRRCSTRRSSGRRRPTASRRCRCSSSSAPRVDADPYRGTPLAWAAANGRVAAIRQLVELGADPNQRGTFGGPTHGEGVTALHLAAQSGKRDAVEALLELGADPTIRDATPRRARHRAGPSPAGTHEIAELLRAHAGETTAPG